jgi:hypothetical protein
MPPRSLILRHNLLHVAKEKGSVLTSTTDFGTPYRFTESQGFGYHYKTPGISDGFLGCVRVRYSGVGEV